MGIVIPDFVGEYMNENSTVNSVRADDWTDDFTLISTNADLLQLA